MHAISGGIPGEPRSDCAIEISALRRFHASLPTAAVGLAEVVASV
jgi:hypothetical protein